ncbi:CRISPR-associated helicase Cas3' [Nonomuraea sp. KC401]|uniref:CRISPR-associated helicase Cas3' n=1 Tax=unclassified Nonomuraea TaxID=2593643 RepID=UPI0010FE9D28|nr:MULTISPECIES: CRISPR-associated helicase Cas3' [unclassified Nonomuraea]NBE91841.1 CRISPR-associated helicase Cas3' [Nonomuraea sp. K271]TLF86435.1 CRISPR-associated helicase Cas3' [Nonomuraea sp. KC401]
MSSRPGPVQAVRVELYAPVASFRDPMFPGVSRCLPVPPPSTVRGMLAAATGRASEPVALGLAAWAEGRGLDAETYHPIAADGSNPAVAGRVAAGKGGMTIRDRPFLIGVRLTIWIPGPEGDRIAQALRRPVWGLRLGRTQDLVHIVSIRQVTLQPTERATVGHALAPVGGHEAPLATTLRLAESISSDRGRTEYRSYQWCSEPAGEHAVAEAYRDEDQAVWLSSPVASDEDGTELSQVLAKSASGSGLGRPELLTEHSLAVRDAARAVAGRIGSPGVLATHPRFWSWAESAALLHDAGKVAEGFQRQLRPGGESWGERHEVLSLAYVDLLTRNLDGHDRKMIAAGVAFHHRPLVSHRSGDLRSMYPPVAAWERKFGHDPAPVLGRARIQVPAARHREWLAWLARRLAVPVPANDRRLWELARDAFARLSAEWINPVSEEEGLVAVLLQGAVTLADHSGSAHVPLQTHMPLPRNFLSRLPTPYPHQRQAADTAQHLILVSPTGSGKTEAGLSWASRQLDDMPAQPRLVWLLPYRASIDAARDRFIANLDPAPGQERPDIGVLHATAARTLLTRAIADDCTPGPADARRARARAGAMRLFSQQVRVATPHQLLRAAIAGTRYSSVLLEQANALMILDELHAYDPATFGRICACMRLWQQLGSRVAVLSATLAQPMITLIRDTLGSVEVRRAPTGTAPPRHRLTLDEDPIDSGPSIERIRRWLEEGQSVLVIANTVATAQELYTRFDHPDVMLLHSRFRSQDRAEIERRILQRYPERKPGETTLRGGLVVATQAVEVSLCLDFDRGVTELAPIEAIAQRAGRINRRGRHPDGLVEFRVHTKVVPNRPYDEGALDASLTALTSAPGPEISEETIETWLDVAYSTAWGQRWAAEAERHRDEFSRDFLTFPDPFHDRSEFAAKLDEAFDTVEVLLSADLDTYRTEAEKNPLLAAGLLIPIRYTQLAALRAAGRAEFVKGDLRLWVIDAEYSPVLGLDLQVQPAPVPETVL